MNALDGLDILVNNAGIADEYNVEKMFAVNSVSINIEKYVLRTGFHYIRYRIFRQYPVSVIICAWEMSLSKTGTNKTIVYSIYISISFIKMMNNINNGDK